MKHSGDIKKRMDERISELRILRRFMDLNQFTKAHVYLHPTTMEKDKEKSFGEQIAYLEGEIRGLNFSFYRKFESD